MKNIIEREMGNHPKRSIITIVLLSTLLIAFIGALRQYNWISMLTIVIIAVILCLPMLVGKLSHIDIPSPLAIFSILFLYASLFLGEIKNYYATYWWWDVLLHTSSGVALGMVGFLILYILYKAEKIKTSPKTIAMFAFAFALAIGALWEIVEFTIDNILGTNMQTVANGCGLFDTMWDLIVDAFGALFSAVMGYLYITRKSGIVVKQVTKEFKKDNPRLFKTEK